MNVFLVNLVAAQFLQIIFITLAELFVTVYLHYKRGDQLNF
ncbi:hypothetical protein ES288_A07G090900v1 [Gossypium darwinii]|uniref:Uncharacterized protein n=1 Tax=Gossypium darwinii TaxID=34276 RepID=A0A5D2FXD6_GOSDA|nr:hypothetical protein ES288_A07G090900v1 [Gossypium darwinii]